MIKTAISLLVLGLACRSAPAEYVVLTGVDESDPYHAAARLLAAHHGTDRILRFDPRAPEAILPLLREAPPTQVAIVLRPAQIHVNSVRRILRMAAAVDPDPFVDFDFGYLTGGTAEEAVEFVRNMIEASKGKSPLVVGKSAVWGGNSPCRKREGTYVVGDRKFPLRDLVFTAPDGKQGRNQAFIDEHLKYLEGCGAILMGGHGMPWEIVSGPRAEDVGELTLFPAVAFNYACHTGVTRLYPERRYQGGKFLLELKEVEAERSFALAMIRTGVTGYVAYVNPRPAGPELSIDFQRVLAGASMGEARRNDYAKIALGYLGFEEPGIVPPEFVAGREVTRAEMDPVRHLMLDGATGGILYGDPARRPFERDPSALPLTIEAERLEDGLRVTLGLEAGYAYVWGVDPFRRFDEKSPEMAMKIYGRVKISGSMEKIREVRIESATAGGKPIETLDPVWAVETDRGERYLHLKANYRRGARGDVEVRFLVR